MCKRYSSDEKKFHSISISCWDWLFDVDIVEVGAQVSAVENYFPGRCEMVKLKHINPVESLDTQWKLDHPNSLSSLWGLVTCGLVQWKMVSGHWWPDTIFLILRTFPRPYDEASVDTTVSLSVSYSANMY